MEEFICVYCNKEFKSKLSKASHERLCKFNPNIQKSGFERYNQKRALLGICGKNQYTKAKELGKEKPSLSKEARQRIRDAHTGLKHTDETKNKIRETQKKNYLGKSKWYTQTQHRLSYAEQYFIKIFTDAKLHFHVNRFFLDFAWPDKKIYIEVDGSQHKTDPKVVEHDIERTKILSRDGWVLVERIYWPDFSNKTDDEKKSYIDYILQKLSKYKCVCNSDGRVTV